MQENLVPAILKQLNQISWCIFEAATLGTLGSTAAVTWFFLCSFPAGYRSLTSHVKQVFVSNKSVNLCDLNLCVPIVLDFGSFFTM